MKNFILIGAIGLIINISNVSASSIFVDNENDVQRVHRNVIRFCSYHSKQLLDLRNNNFDPTKCSRIFQELRRSDSDLIREFNDNPNYFIKDLSKTFSYLHKNNIEARKILGEENYNYFYAGLRYLDEIIYGFSLECKKQAKEKEESVSYDKKIKRNQNENYSSKKTNRSISNNSGSNNGSIFISTDDFSGKSENSKENNMSVISNYSGTPTILLDNSKNK